MSALDEAAEADTVQEIFSEILDAFYHINFYNLLNWPLKKEITAKQWSSKDIIELFVKIPKFL